MVGGVYFVDDYDVGCFEVGFIWVVFEFVVGFVWVGNDYLEVWFVEWEVVVFVVLEDYVGFFFGFF